MTINDIKLLLVGVIKQYFPNRKTLKNLTENEEGKLLYNGEVMATDTNVSEEDLQAAIADIISEINKEDTPTVIPELYPEDELDTPTTIPELYPEMDDTPTVIPELGDEEPIETPEEEPTEDPVEPEEPQDEPVVEPEPEVTEPESTEPENEDPSEVIEEPENPEIEGGTE